MDQKILSAVDHTLLTQTAAWAEVKQICDDAVEYRTASVCIPPSYVKRAKEYVGDRMKVCTVIGFPNGYQTAEVKVFETEDAVRNGADEIDMVISIGALKDGDYETVKSEIEAVKAACKGRILKVIIETLPCAGSYRNPEPILSRLPPDFQKRVRPSGISHCLKPMWTLA